MQKPRMNLLYEQDIEKWVFKFIDQFPDLNESYFHPICFKDSSRKEIVLEKEPVLGEFAVIVNGSKSRNQILTKNNPSGDYSAIINYTRDLGGVLPYIYLLLFMNQVDFYLKITSVIRVSHKYSAWSKIYLNTLQYVTQQKIPDILPHFKQHPEIILGETVKT